MTSFIAETFSLISNEPETIAAVLATARPFMNSSIVPVTLSSESLWKKLCANDVQQDSFVTLFSTFSDTMQFTGTLKLYHRRLITGVLEDLIKYKRYFCRTLKHFDVPHENALALVDNKLLNIRTIDLRLCTLIDDTHLELICKNFPHLTTLDFSGRKEITDNSLASISNLKSLEVLDLSGNNNITRLPFLKDLKRLKSLILKNAKSLTDDAFQFDHDGKRSNHRINDNYIVNDNNDDDVQEENEKESTMLPSLTKLNIENCDTLTDTALKHLQKHAPNLISLITSSISTDDGFKTIGKMYALQSINVSSIIGGHTLTGDSVVTLTKHLPDLRELSFMLRGGYVARSSNCFHKISQIPAPIRKLVIDTYFDLRNVDFRLLCALQHLETLEIHGSSHSLFNGDISENFSFSKTLTELILDGCNCISDQGIASILKSLSLKTLRLPNMFYMTSEGLRNALEKSDSRKTLQVLDVSQCLKIDDLSFLEGLEALVDLHLMSTITSVETMRANGNDFAKFSTDVCSLEMLVLDLTLVQDTEILQFPSKWNETMKSLSVYGCYELTTTSLERISQMKALEYLDIGGYQMTRITVESIANVIDALPLLVKISVDEKNLQKIKEDPKLMKRVGHLFS